MHGGHGLSFQGADKKSEHNQQAMDEALHDHVEFEVIFKSYFNVDARCFDSQLTDQVSLSQILTYGSHLDVITRS